MDCREIRFSRHAIERMFERAISPGTVKSIVRDGEVIASYPDDRPFPSALVLGFDRDSAIHIVVARDDASGLCYVVTAYRPNPAFWSGDFRVRRE